MEQETIEGEVVGTAVAKTGGAVAIAESPQVSLASILEVKGQLVLLRQLVLDVLERGIDYDKMLGWPQPALLDPGASKIISTFRCFAGERRILKLEDNEQRISVVLEVPLISMLTGKIVGTGIGAASTGETKYKYRHITYQDALDAGYTEETITTLKKKKPRPGESGEILYRIPNPEHSELLNTLVKMCSKRAEVDAAESLPGVASTLRALFKGQMKQAPGGGAKFPTWNQFWGEMKRLGIEREDVYAIIEMESAELWRRQHNYTIDDCVNFIRDQYLARKPAAAPAAAPPPATAAILDEEFFPEEESPGKIWDEIRALLKLLALPQKNLQTWWNQYSIAVISEDFTFDIIPDKFKTDQLIHFRTQLQALQKQREAKRKAATPQQSPSLM